MWDAGIAVQRGTSRLGSDPGVERDDAGARARHADCVQWGSFGDSSVLLASGRSGRRLDHPRPAYLGFMFAASEIAALVSTGARRPRRRRRGRARVRRLPRLRRGGRVRSPAQRVAAVSRAPPMPPRSPAGSSTVRSAGCVATPSAWPSPIRLSRWLARRSCVSCEHPFGAGFPRVLPCEPAPALDVLRAPVQECLFDGGDELVRAAREHDVRRHSLEIRIAARDDRLTGGQVFVQLEREPAPHPVVPLIRAQADVERRHVPRRGLRRVGGRARRRCRAASAARARLERLVVGRPDQEDRPVGVAPGGGIDEREVDLPGHEAAGEADHRPWQAGDVARGVRSGRRHPRNARSRRRCRRDGHSGSAPMPLEERRGRREDDGRSASRPRCLPRGRGPSRPAP